MEAFALVFTLRSACPVVWESEEYVTKGFCLTAHTCEIDNPTKKCEHDSISEEKNDKVIEIRLTGSVTEWAHKLHFKDLYIIAQSEIKLTHK